MEAKLIVAVAGSGSKAGKSTFCDMLLRYIVRKDWQVLSTSETLIENLAYKLQVAPAYIKEHKELYRQDLIDMSKHDPMFPMYTTLLSWDTGRHLLLESVRRKCEFDYLRNQKNVIFIYIQTKDQERMNRGSGTVDINEVENLMLPEGEPIKNCYMVYNNGNLGQLEYRAKDIADILYRQYIK